METQRVIAQPEREQVGPYQLLNEIGAGSIGRVFRARHGATGEVVAVKSLRPDAGSADLASLKREFRVATGIVSDHLVPIYDLFVSSSTAHIVMPLLQGRTFDRWAETESWRRRPRSLIEVLRAVAIGIGDLHRAGLVHRDIKPQNIMIEPDGRILVLDFGLATQRVSPDAFVTSSPSMIAGTFAFMAPEAMMGAEPRRELDLFALGATAFAVICGRPPPRRPGRWDVPWPGARSRLHASWSDCPPSLSRLTGSLLATDPDQRPSLDAVLNELDALARERRPLSVPPNESLRHPILGRERELAEVRDALERDRAPLMILGPSGIGKTSLVTTILSELRRTNRRELILSGRCHPGEHIRYRLLDSLIDELTRWLIRCGAPVQRDLLPHEFATLCQAFPVMRQLASSGRACEGSSIVEAEGQRRLLVHGLARLMENVAATWKTVVWIDDVQWADEDGMKLLVEVVGRFRGERLALILSGQSIPEPLAVLRGPRVALGPIGDDDARALIRNRATPDWSRNDSELVLKSASGNPGLLSYMIQHWSSGAGGEPRSLSGLVAKRLAKLGAEARELAGALAIAAHPLPEDVSVAMGYSNQAIHQLDAIGLVRVVPYRRGRALEIAHERLRVSIASAIPEERVRSISEALARGYESGAPGDRRQLAEHWLRSGDVERAREHLDAAARHAMDALAFDHAVDCYQRIFELEPTEDPRLNVRMGDALARSGRRKVAAEHYERAARALAGDEGPRHLGHAAIELLHAGYMDEGLNHARCVFRHLGIRLPTTLAALFVALILQRLWIWLRGVQYRLREDERNPDVEIADIAYSLSTALLPVDTLLAYYVHGLHWLHSLRCGHPRRVVRALAMEAGFRSASAEHSDAPEELLSQARLIAGVEPEPKARALFAISRASGAWARGHWGECFEAAQEAEEIASRECEDAWWELSFSRSVLQDALRWMGRYRELASRTDEYIADAVARGDRYARITFRARFATTIELVRGRMEPARIACMHEEEWATRGVHLQHLAILHARAEFWLYAGEPERALRMVEQGYRAMRFSGTLRLGAPRAKLLHLLASCRLAVAARVDEVAPSGRVDSRSLDAARSRTLDSARRLAKEIRRAAAPYALFLADTVELGAQRLTGEPRASGSRSLHGSTRRGGVAPLVDPSELAGTARRLEMPQFGEALLMSASGLSQRAAAKQALMDRGVAEPERWAAVLTPGWVGCEPSASIEGK